MHSLLDAQGNRIRSMYVASRGTHEFRSIHWSWNDDERVAHVLLSFIWRNPWWNGRGSNNQFCDFVCICTRVQLVRNKEIN